MRLVDDLNAPVTGVVSLVPGTIYSMWKEEKGEFFYEPVVK